MDSRVLHADRDFDAFATHLGLRVVSSDRCVGGVGQTAARVRGIGGQRRAGSRYSSRKPPR